MNHGDRVFVKLGGQLLPGVVDAVLPPYVAVLIKGQPVPYLLNVKSVIHHEDMTPQQRKLLGRTDDDE